MFEKIQQPVMMQNTQRNKNKGELNKDVCEKLIANIIVKNIL